MTDSQVRLADSRKQRPHHLHPGLILTVAVGGALGTAGRYVLETRLPAGDGLPLGTAIANLVGAFALGVLLEILARPTPEEPQRRVLRLGLGTGMLGGFTSYSALALETHHLFTVQPALALAYSMGSVLLGVCAAFAGVVVSAAVARRRAPLLPRDPDAEELQAQSRPRGRRP